jgi:hypothetical protein
MKYSIIPVLLFWANAASSQIVVGVENEESKNTLTKLAYCLFSGDASTYNKDALGEDKSSKETAFYRRIIRQFFDSSKMDERFRQIAKDNGTSYNQIKSEQYSTLSKMSDMLRHDDSIYIMGWKECKRRNDIEDTAYNKNTVIIGSIIDSYWLDRYFIEFDDTGKKIILMGSTAVLMEREILKRKIVTKKYPAARKKTKNRKSKF